MNVDSEPVIAIMASESSMFPVGQYIDYSNMYEIVCNVNEHIMQCAIQDPDKYPPVEVHCALLARYRGYNRNTACKIRVGDGTTLTDGILASLPDEEREFAKEYLELHRSTSKQIDFAQKCLMDLSADMSNPKYAGEDMHAYFKANSEMIAAEIERLTEIRTQLNSAKTISVINNMANKNPKIK